MTEGRLKIVDIMETFVWNESKLIQIPRADKPDVNKMIHEQGLSEEEARHFKRRFRKAWRKLTRSMPKHRRQREVSGAKKEQTRREFCELCPGLPPRGAISENRKRAVMIAVRLKAYELEKHFTLGLNDGVKPATSGVL